MRGGCASTHEVAAVKAHFNIFKLISACFTIKLGKASRSRTLLRNKPETGSVQGFTTLTRCVVEAI